MSDFLFSDGPIQALQKYASPLLDAFFWAVTNTGSALLLFVLAVLVYWLLDKRTGLLLAVALLISSAVNGVLKRFFGMPRPPEAVQKIVAEGNGFPSGHAQQSSSLWSVAAFRLRKMWIPLAIVAIPLISLSRVYLGVHFVGDVLGGVAIGIAIGALTLLAAKTLPWSRLPEAAKFALAGVIPCAAAGVLAVLGEPVVTSLGRLSGVAVGFLIEEKWVRLAVPARRSSLVLRVAIGGPALAGLLTAAARLRDLPVIAFGFEALVGLAVMAGLPWVFVRLEPLAFSAWRRIFSREGSV